MTIALSVWNEAVEMVRLQSSAVVVGLGKTGMSCVRFLVANGYSVSVVDSRMHPPLRQQLLEQYPDVPLRIGFDSQHFSEADMVVVSPGVSSQEPAIRGVHRRGAEVIGDVELFARHAQSPVIAITGSNGKSTVTAMVGEMCRAAGLDAAVAGNIGVPVLDLLDASHPIPDWYVLELSSFQLETTDSLRPRVAALLNVSPDHMDRYLNLDAYARTKARIFRGDGVAVVNRDDAAVSSLVPANRSLLTFGFSPPQRENEFGVIQHGDDLWLAHGDTRLMPRHQVQLVGNHNVLNVLAAMALAGVVGASHDAMVSTARRFRGLPHRTELVLEHNGIRWVNDSKATNVGATAAALYGADAPVVLIAGGDGKGADFSPLRDAITGHVRAAILFGQDAEVIAKVIGSDVACHRVHDLAEAVNKAEQLAVCGDMVMLSPACASFDMFENFEQRGESFRRLVHGRFE